MVDPITATHQAVEARLRTAFAHDRWTFELVPSPLTLEEFRSIVAKATPWLGFAWREVAVDQASGRRITGRLGFTLTIVIKNTGREARFTGDRLGPGLYSSTLIAAALLSGLKVDGVGTLFVSRAGSAFADGWSDMSIAIGTIELDMTTDLADVLAALATSDDFLRLVSDWDLSSESEPSDTIEVEGP